MYGPMPDTSRTRYETKHCALCSDPRKLSRYNTVVLLYTYKNSMQRFLKARSLRSFEIEFTYHFAIGRYRW